MTVIRGTPSPIAPTRAQPASPAAKSAPASGTPPEPAPDSSYGAGKKRPLSITGRRPVVTAPAEETVSVSALLRSEQEATRRRSRSAPAEETESVSLLSEQQATRRRSRPAPAAAAPPPPVLDDVGRANEALASFPVVPADHPAARHATSVRDQLRREGLPTDASGVDVFIVGDSPEHGAMVARAVAGQTGLATGAALHLSERLDNPAIASLDPDQQNEVAIRALSVKTGSATIDDVRQATVEALEAAYLSPKAELDYLVEHTPADGKTRIVNMSWGTSEENMVSTALQGAIDNPDSPLIAAANGGRRKQGLAPLDLTRAEDQAVLRTFLREQVKAALADPAARARLSDARKEATAAVARAREAGFLPIAAAGNFFEPGVHDDSSRGTANVVATIPGVVSVGATAFGDPTKLGDESMGESSSTGAAIAAPGVDLPISLDRSGKPVDVSGTSFAAPYVGAVAALMVKANPNITPDQLERILRSDAVAENVKGTRRDGAGVIDAAAAVREAKALLRYDGPSKVHTSTDLPLATQRELRETLRELMPTTSPAYRAALRLGTNDAFIELGAGAQKAMLDALVADRSDSALAGRLLKLAECKPFHELGPAAQARVAANFANQFDGKEILEKLNDRSLSSHDVRVKDAYLAAFSKAPDKSAELDQVLGSASFRALEPEVQQAFFEAVEQNTDAFREEDPGRARLFEFVKSADFVALTPAGQERWLRGLGTAGAEARDAAFKRLDQLTAAKSTGVERQRAFHAAGSVLLHPRENSPMGRYPLPGASTSEPSVTSRETKAAVFVSLELGGLDPRPRPVTLHTVSIDGQAIKVYLPSPLPPGRDFPSVDVIVQGLAGLPETLRKSVQEVIVDPAYRDGIMAGVARPGKPNRIFMGSEAPANEKHMAAMLSHEATHVKTSRMIERDPAIATKWRKAIDGDDHWPSQYAATHLQEDLAETAQLYFQVKGTAGEATMKREMPRRYAMLKELLGEP